MDADEVFISTDQELMEDYRARLEKRKIFHDGPIALDAETYEITLPPGHALRFQAHRALADERMESGFENHC